MKLKRGFWGYSKKSVDNYTKELEENNRMKLEMVKKEYELKKQELQRQIDELKSMNK